MSTAEFYLRHLETVDFTGAGVTVLAFDGASKTAALAVGTYLIWADQPAGVRVGPQVSVTATTKEAIPANTAFRVNIDATNDTIGAIKVGSAGNLYARKVH